MRNKRGFTLIELLVVVAIIALLISILLPSIESARAQARAVVCSTKLHDIHNAQNNYAVQFSDWIPGAPGTTAGHLLYDDYGDYAFDIPGVPVQNWDWQSPLAHYGLGIESGLEDRNERWQWVREQPLFTCPSNNFVVPPFPIAQLSNGWAVLQMNSYSTIREFMYYGSTTADDPERVHIPASWEVKTPEGHVPRFTNVQKPSQKGLVVEGTRFLREDLPAPDYDVNYNASVGGSFATAGPSSSYSRAFINPVDLQQNEHDAKWDRYSFRHPVAGAPGFNVLFFDGHASRQTKIKAIEGVDFWLPTGTKVGVSEYDGTGPFDPVPKPRALRIILQRTPDDEGFYPIY
ncbi:MAG: prepilin-type N-terminal cleavage/methylation domain-containing protein [Planctomycetes bacterium]|nr:prepilin-type N-terminal cleavage/methylation domain-containing protein [Planctomycetota bacterium]